MRFALRTTETCTLSLQEARRDKMVACLLLAHPLKNAAEFCALEDFEGRISIAASNSSSNITLSDDADAIAEAQAISKKRISLLEPLE